MLGKEGEVDQLLQGIRYFSSSYSKSRHVPEGIVRRLVVGRVVLGCLARYEKETHTHSYKELFKCSTKKARRRLELYIVIFLLLFFLPFFYLKSCYIDIQCYRAAVHSFLFFFKFWNIHGEMPSIHRMPGILTITNETPFLIYSWKCTLLLSCSWPLHRLDFICSLLLLSHAICQNFLYFISNSWADIWPLEKEKLSSPNSSSNFHSHSHIWPRQ